MEVKITNEVIRNIYERRAVRKFKDTPVSNDIITALLDAARMAPSAMNKQPWHFYVISDKALIQSISNDIIAHSKFAMFKSGIKEAVKTILHPGSFHLKDGIDFFKADDPIFHGAPAVIFISSPKNSEWAMLDVGMCCQNIMLAAKSLGLDSCPVGLAKFIEHTESVKLLNMPDGHQVNLALIIGYGDETPLIHERNKDNVSYISSV